MSRNRASAGPAGAAPLFAALGDETRLKLVLRMVSEEPLSIAELASDAAMTRQAVTKHLRVLETVGLATSRRSGRERLWRLNPAQVAEARRCLELIGAQWEQALGRLKSSLE